MSQSAGLATRNAVKLRAAENGPAIEWRAAMKIATLVLVLTVLAGCAGSNASSDGSPAGTDGGVDADQSPVTREEFLRACVTEASCYNHPVDCSLLDPIEPLTTPDIFVPLVSKVNAQRFRCLASLNGDCSRAIDCIGFGPVGSTNVDCSNQGYSCDGDKQVYTWCDALGNFKYAFDCKALDPRATCQVWKPGFAPICGVGTCDLPGGTCDGNRYMDCGPEGELMSFDCGTSGLFQCDPMNGCSGTGSSCQRTGDSCNGTIAVICENGRQANVDCASLAEGARCVGRQGVNTSAAYCSYGDACVGQMATCSGTMLSYCAGDRMDVVDCTALGFANCMNGLCVN
jgi:hypothetical protein